MRLFLFAVLFITVPLAAQAEIISAGEPRVVRIETDPGFVFADIYQRQLAFRDKRQLLSQDLRERQKNFIAPHIETHRQYQKDVQTMHQSIK